MSARHVSEQLRGIFCALELLGDAMVVLVDTEDEDVQQTIGRARKHIGRAIEELAEVIQPALSADSETAERERDDLGPYFVRDMARLVGLPDEADMNAIAARAERQADALREAREALKNDRGNVVWHEGHAEPIAEDCVLCVIDTALASPSPAEEPA